MNNIENNKPAQENTGIEVDYWTGVLMQKLKLTAEKVRSRNPDIQSSEPITREEVITYAKWAGNDPDYVEKLNDEVEQEIKEDDESFDPYLGLMDD